MIIDAHCHLFDANARDRYFWLDGQPEGPVPPEQYEQCILAQPVDHVLLSADPGLLKTAEGLARANDLVAQAAQAHPARISGLCQVNPHLPKESLDEIDKHVAKGNFVGIGEICQHVLEFDTCDETVYPMIERAIDRPPDGREYPFHNFLALSGKAADAEGTLALVSRDVYAADATADGCVHLTLLRAPAYAHHDPYVLGERHLYPITGQGMHEYEVALMPAAVLDMDAIGAEADRQRRPLWMAEVTRGMR